MGLLSGLKNYFLLVTGALDQNYCIRVFISCDPTPNLFSFAYTSDN